MKQQTRRKPVPPAAAAADGAEKTVEYRLSPVQQTTARTLGEEMRRIIDDGNRRVAELEEAIQELANEYAAKFGAKGTPSFVVTNGGRVITLVVKPDPQPTDLPAGPEPAAAG